MAKSIKIWSGTEWIDLAIIAPTISGLATASSLSQHAADTTDIHGISNTANLVYTNDSRLTDSRTPNSHASTHENGGVDEIEIAQSQVTNLETDLLSVNDTINDVEIMTVMGVF